MQEPLRHVPKCRLESLALLALKLLRGAKPLLVLAQVLEGAGTAQHIVDAAEPCPWAGNLICAGNPTECRRR